MTDQQKQRIKDKIEKIRNTLRAEKRKFGGFDDSRALRYIPTALYLKLGDFKGGLRYLNWFNKNFPNDIGFPGFLFESTIIFYKNRKFKEAEHTALRTYFSHTFLIDKYFSIERTQTENKINSSYQQASSLLNFVYRHDQNELLEFSGWLNNFMRSERFIKTKQEFENITGQLESEPVGPKRKALVNRLTELL